MCEVQISVCVWVCILSDCSGACCVVGLIQCVCVQLGDGGERLLNIYDQ